MLDASLLTGAFVVLAVGARYLPGNRPVEEARTMLRMALSLAAVLSVPLPDSAA
jgi:cytochrome bd ubiquinol oxidase subunit I